MSKTRPLMSLLTLSILFAVAYSTDVYIDLTASIATSSSRFTSYNFDWHKNSEEPPLWVNCSVQVIDLDSPYLNTAVQGLRTRLRIGGSEEDDIVYNVTGNECNISQTDPAFCLSMDRWKQIVDFTTRNELDLVFGLNAMDRKDDNSPENFTNIEAFLQYTYDNNLKVFGFEFGNELPKVNAKVDANDYINLYTIIQSIWNSTGNATRKEVPRVCGNDLNPDATYIQQWLPLVKDYLDVYTYHNYDGYGLDTNLTNEIVTPQFLDKTYNNVKSVLASVTKYAKPGTEIWLGEAAAAWHSGQENTTNAFVSSFWYADALGRLASLNHTGFCRQTLIGGAYGLLTRDGYYPNPDYYTAKLFHDLAGDMVLKVTNISDNYKGYFRAYSYCSRIASGHVGILLINISPTETVNTIINIFDKNGPRSIVSMDVYELTSTDGLNSRVMNMNGKELKMDNANTLPCLVSCPRSEQGDNIQVKPYSIVYLDAEPANRNNICA
eukprot:249260_1